MKLDVELLKTKLDKLKFENEELRENMQKQNAKMREMQRAFKASPQDKWYIQYLMNANARLEYELENRQEIISKYQKHYAKWGDFYARYQQEHPQMLLDDESSMI